MALPPSNPLTPQEKRAQRDAAEQEVLLREVDDAVRQGDTENFLRQWGKPLLGGIVLVLALFAGYLFWQDRQEKALERESEQLVAALDQLQAGNVKTADQQLAALGGTGTVAANAKMLRAGIAAQQGRLAEASRLFAEVSVNEDAPPALRDLAKIRSVVAGYDSMDRAAIVTALKPLAVPGKPYFASAGELLAHAYLDQGKRAEAGTLFAQIAKDENAPKSVQSRARQMAGALGVDAVVDVDAVLKEQGVEPMGDASGAPAAPTQQ